MTDGDTGVMAALFAPDVVIEDPAGTSPVHGAEAIAGRVNAATVPGGLEVIGPVCGTPTIAAAPLRATFVADGAEHTIDVIDVFRFDEQGRITSMIAYFGGDNIH